MDTVKEADIRRQRRGHCYTLNGFYRVKAWDTTVHVHVHELMQRPNKDMKSTTTTTMPGFEMNIFWSSITMRRVGQVSRTRSKPKKCSFVYSFTTCPLLTTRHGARQVITYINAHTKQSVFTNMNITTENAIKSIMRALSHWTHQTIHTHRHTPQSLKFPKASLQHKTPLTGGQGQKKTAVEK